MSRQNKVNRDNYTQAGRLTPDDMARERQKQTRRRTGSMREHIMGRGEEKPARPRGGRASSRPRSAPEE